MRRGKGPSLFGDCRDVRSGISYVYGFYISIFEGDRQEDSHCEFHETFVQWAGNRFQAVGGPDSTPA